MAIPPDHEMAKKLLGDHKNFESLAKEKFAKYQELAENFMKQGKYYDAINSWQLAEVWYNNHPDSSMGRGQALFAAGEYMSSVYYVEKAMAFSELYAAQKTDLLKLIDQTVFSENMIELEDIYKRSKSYRLGFLLAYLDYQAQKIDKSTEYLTAIEDRMIQSQAYLNLKKAVDRAATREGSK
jgi:tetratricopeptide (TPR) repeat protein